MMKPRRSSPLRTAIIAGAGALLLLGGCSSTSVNLRPTPYDWGDLKKPFFQYDYTAGPPIVQNCGIIAISTPSVFRCNGKTYTSIQLADMHAAANPVPAQPPSVPRSYIQR
jgi:hypothetical protein